MNSFAVVAFFACVAACSAGLVGPSAHILQGPSSKTTLVGPEGSVISAHAPGGQIVHEEHPGFVAHAAPVLAHAAPVVAHAAPVVYSSPVVAHAAPVVAHAAPAHSTVVAHSSAYKHDSVVVAGPSGTISTGHGAHAVPAVAYAAPVVAHAAPVVAYSAPVVAHYDVDNNGYEGQYVHDHSETLYDDGSYKPHHYHY
ncbi:cuticle protein 16.5-like [Sitophilus oryzae]|uniref:Cuticle protein 16.5-like n=1 Tax=Sitophilus oryzae TaxID=7048 RepID=A0A6J2YSQ6_SITOR|nr:cuticle protein 16.5-like [Sitophilus oryzae]